MLRAMFDEVAQHYTSKTCRYVCGTATVHTHWSYHQLAFILSEALVKMPKQLWQTATVSVCAAGASNKMHNSNTLWIFQPNPCNGDYQITQASKPACSNITHQCDSETLQYKVQKTTTLTNAVTPVVFSSAKVLKINSLLSNHSVKRTA